MRFKPRRAVYRLVAFAIVISLGISMTACEKGQKTKNKYVDYSFDYFDTFSSITGYETTQEEFDATLAELYKILEKCHKQYNIYLAYEGVNNVLVVNSVDKNTGKHSVVEVEQETWDMLMFSKYIYELTGGRTNIAMGSVLKLWHNARQYGESNPESSYLPDMNALKEAALHTSFDTVIFDENNRTVYLSDPLQSLDVGAVAKGYAIELMAKYLVENGKTGYCLNVGGNVRAIGGKPEINDKAVVIADWGVGLENPYFDSTKDKAEDAYITIIRFKDKAIATSGSYQRFYYVDGVAYHHIIDPDTLMPGNRWVSVSVISDDAGLSDGLSTALFNMDLEEGMALIESLPGVEALWMTPAPECLITKSSGFSAYE